MTNEEVIETLKQAIDLIEEQQVKINKLEKSRQKQSELLSELRAQKYELMNRISAVKNEAYKEFVERLKSYLLLNKKGEMSVISFENVDTLLKEMVGEEE